MMCDGAANMLLRFPAAVGRADSSPDPNRLEAAPGLPRIGKPDPLVPSSRLPFLEPLGAGRAEYL